MSNLVFGNIFVPATIERATKELLITWYPTFIKQICTELGEDIIKAPSESAYTARNKYEELQVEELPKVVIIAPGIIGSPKMGGDRIISATWRIGVGVATAATDEETAKLHCDILGSAAREVMIKKGGGALGGSIHFLDEQYVDLPISNQLATFRAASLSFSVDIRNVSTKRGGPMVPDADPYSYPLVETVIIDKEKEGINGS